MGGGNSGKKGVAYCKEEIEEYIRLKEGGTLKRTFDYKDESNNKKTCKKFLPNIGDFCCAPDPNRCDKKRVFRSVCTSDNAMNHKDLTKHKLGQSIGHGKKRYCLAWNDPEDQLEVYNFLLKELACKPTRFVKQLTKEALDSKNGKDRFLQACCLLLLDRFDLAPKKFLEAWGDKKLKGFQVKLEAYAGAFGEELQTMKVVDPSTGLPDPGLDRILKQHDYLFHMLIQNSDRMDVTIDDLVALLEDVENKVTREEIVENVKLQMEFKGKAHENVYYTTGGH